MHDIPLAQFAGLRWTARPSAFAGWTVVAVLLIAVGAFIFGWSIGTAVLAGLVATVGYVLSAGWHQFGHAIAARSTGYPMTSVRFWGVLDSSIYPATEPALAPAIHIRRALGGPIASLALAVIFAIVTLLQSSPTSPTARIVQFLFLLNFVVYTLQVFVPLGFNDGTTLMRWLPKLLRGER